MDSARLEYKMRKRNVSVRDMCAELGISRSAFYRKRSGKSEFTQGEIQKMVNYLELETPMGIFFTERVS